MMREIKLPSKGRVMKRRTFLKAGVVGGGATALLGLASCTTFSPTNEDSRKPAAAPAPGTPLRIRRDVNSPEAQKDLNVYKKALEIMRKNPRKINGIVSGLSFAEQAQIHMDYCPHGTWKFFPWHREYLFRYEEIIRAVSGDESFALPYWDWSKSQRIPKIFLENGSLFLNESNRTRDLKNSIINECSDFRIKSFKSTKNFLTFMGSAKGSGEIESAPHNTVHVAVGGTMATFLSPGDPVFWCHHANVDRLWSEWQEENNFFNGVAPVKDYEKWLVLELDGFYDRKGVRMTKWRMAKDVIDTKNCGYLYDTSSRIPKSVVAGAVPKAMAMDAAEPVTEFNRRTIIETDPELMPAESYQRVAGKYKVTLDGLPDNAREIFQSYMSNYEEYEDYQLNLQIVDVPDFPKGTRMAIYLLDGDQKYHVINYTVFKDPNAKHRVDPNNPHALHHPTKRTLNFDYTKTLDLLMRNNTIYYPQRTEFLVELLSADGEPLDVKDPKTLNMQYTVALYGKQGSK
jgi:hypothetical protein